MVGKAESVARAAREARVAQPLFVTLACSPVATAELEAEAAPAEAVAEEDGELLA